MMELVKQQNTQKITTCSGATGWVREVAFEVGWRLGMRLASSNSSLIGAWYVLDVSVGKGYTYSLLSENLIVRGKNYAERT